MSVIEATKAMNRITALVDEGSFVSIGAQVTVRSTDYTLQSQAAPGDGVITGYATINGKLCYIYSQDASVLGGSLGEMHAKKIVKIYNMAMKMGAPVIGLLDCAGVRLEEVTDALNGFGELYLSQAKASGLIPVISMIFGKCGGGMAVSAGMSDFVFMEEKDASLYVSAPNTLDGNYKEKCNTASASFQAENTGIVDGYGSEEEIISSVRELISVLPANNMEAEVADAEDDLNRLTSDLEGTEDVRAAISQVADSYRFFETKKNFAKDVIAGFIRLDGITVGVIGNEEKTLTSKGAKKAAGFVNFCDAFDMPIVTFTNVNGYASTMEEEKDMAEAGAKLAYAFANADVPKINVVIGEAFGTAGILMNSKGIGADYVYAVENAKIGIMDAKMASKIIAGDAAEFDEKQTALAAAKRGYVDEIITMSTLRKSVLIALEMLYNKREDAPVKKHGAK